jgi:hypothetical protein
MFKSLITPFETLNVEKCFIINGEFCDKNLDKNKEELVKHSIPVWQSLKVKLSEIIDDSSIIKTARLHCLNDSLIKAKQKH